MSTYSIVKYVDIASKVRLDPLLEGDDIPTFPMYRARLTNDVYKGIIENLEDLITLSYKTKSFFALWALKRGAKEAVANIRRRLSADRKIR